MFLPGRNDLEVAGSTDVVGIPNVGIGSGIKLRAYLVQRLGLAADTAGGHSILGH